MKLNNKGLTPLQVFEWLRPDGKISDNLSFIEGDIPKIQNGEEVIPFLIVDEDNCLRHFDRDGNMYELDFDDIKDVSLPKSKYFKDQHQNLYKVDKTTMTIIRDGDSTIESLKQCDSREFNEMFKHLNSSTDYEKLLRKVYVHRSSKDL